MRDKDYLAMGVMMFTIVLLFVLVLYSNHKTYKIQKQYETRIEYLERMLAEHERYKGLKP